MLLHRAIGTGNDFVEPLTRPGGHPLPAVRGEGRGDGCVWFRFEYR